MEIKHMEHIRALRVVVEDGGLWEGAKALIKEASEFDFTPSVIQWQWGETDRNWEITLWGE